jgi:hypothetical protein
VTKEKSLMRLTPGCRREESEPEDLFAASEFFILNIILWNECINVYGCENISFTSWCRISALQAGVT